MQHRETSVISILSAFVVGSLIGAGIALLMAPMSGMETRDMIRSKSMEIKDKAVESAGDTKDRATKAINDIAHQTRERASQLRHRG